jgi:ATP-dependent exoDNAse (exonuclease V) alpha subunit
MELSEDFKRCLHELETTRDCWFITGKAGTGKSTLLRYFRQHTLKKIAVLAPTGIAALNVGGQTIHSFFGFPSRPLKPEDYQKRQNPKIFQALDALVIDEVSMVRVDLMDSIDRFLRIQRDNPAPFGGVQMIFFGDLFQLPPVVASREEAQLLQKHYESPYFFSAKVFTQLDIQVFELREVYRQSQRRFIRLLDAVRWSEMDLEDLQELNERHKPNFESKDYYIILSARNKEVDEINQQRLNALDTDEYQYIAQISGQVPEPLPAESPLRLRIGAQVMFLKNDPKRRYVNGSIGKIVELDVDKILVELPKKGIIELERAEWQVFKHELNNGGGIEAKAVGTYSQYPLRLAWAITIHKSQGKTFDKVIIDLGKGAFEYGQTYVALSRCTSLEGIVLRRPIEPRDILVDPRIVDFYLDHR